MSDPVVEELLEKGARAAFPNAWAASWPGTGGEAVKAQLWAVETVGTVLDAVFPGWREGITREADTLRANLVALVVGELGERGPTYQQAIGRLVDELTVAVRGAGEWQWGTRMPNGNVCEWPHEVSARRAHKASKRFPDGEHPLVSRWVGPWVPVEEGTT